MTGDAIPDLDSVARHCPFGTLDPETSMPTARAFTIRTDIGEDSLSVNWLEYLAPGNPADGLDALRDSPPRRFGGQSKLAVLNVGNTKRLITDDLGIALSVVHDPRPNNESHAQIGISDQSLWHMAALALAESLTRDDVQPAVNNP